MFKGLCNAEDTTGNISDGPGGGGGGGVNGFRLSAMLHLVFGL